MYQTAQAWLMAGSPPHYQQVAALVAYAFLEWVLPRTTTLKANSTVELLANMAKPVLGRVPLVALVVARLATPEASPAPVEAPKSAQGGMIAIPLLWALAVGGCTLAACHLSPKATAAVATIARVQTLDAGIAAFVEWDAAEEQAIAVGAVESCKGQQARSTYKLCTDAYVVPRRAPIDRAKQAIKVYREALAAGGDVQAGNLAGVALDAIRALGAVGIKVLP
jgi:hypothetical protein